MKELERGRASVALSPGGAGGGRARDGPLTHSAASAVALAGTVRLRGYIAGRCSRFSSSMRVTSRSTCARCAARTCSSSRARQRWSRSSTDHSARPPTRIRWPHVIRLVHYVRVPRMVQRKISRRALFARDGWRCVYCGTLGRPADARPRDPALARRRLDAGRTSSRRARRATCARGTGCRTRCRWCCPRARGRPRRCSSSASRRRRSRSAGSATSAPLRDSRHGRRQRPSRARPGAPGAAPTPTTSPGRAGPSRPARCRRCRTTHAVTPEPQ